MDKTRKSSLDQAVTGCILGAAIGDAMGLPFEGLSRSRQTKMYPNIDGYHFLLRRGMVSDDTEHTCMVAQALIVSGGDTNLFGKHMARQMRAWLLCAPAGVGLATLRSCLKLLCGIPWSRSGVFSAGNGPSMRSALIGVCYGDDLPRMRDLVHASTVITHTDPKAEFGAMAVAVAAHYARSCPYIAPATYYNELQGILGDEASEFLDLVSRAVESACDGHATAEFADSLGQQRGVGGYTYHTVPVVLHEWFRFQGDFQHSITEIIRCGGDADTTAAILGSILGAGLGADRIPKALLNGICDWPRSVVWMNRLGSQLVEAATNKDCRKSIPAPLIYVLPRNVLFLLLVLAHGFRRLVPPY